MGLEAFNIKPDNNGGRSKKEEMLSRERANKLALTKEKDTKKFWEKLVDKHANGEKPEGQRMAAICGEVQTLPITVRRKLHEHGIFEYEEIEEIDWGNLEIQYESRLERNSDSNMVQFVQDAK
jgi:hypothetical protein